MQIYVKLQLIATSIGFDYIICQKAIKNEPELFRDIFAGVNYMQNEPRACSRQAGWLAGSGCGSGAKFDANFNMIWLLGFCTFVSTVMVFVLVVLSVCGVRNTVIWSVGVFVISLNSD